MSIEDAHPRLAKFIGKQSIAPLLAAQEVERLRRMWRPDPFKVVLPGESHLWTTPEEVVYRACVP